MGDWMVLIVPVIAGHLNNKILGYELWQILREFIFTHFHGWFCRWFTAVAGPLKLRSWLQQVQLHIESRPKLGKSASIDMIPYRNEQLLVMQNRELEKEFPLKDRCQVGFFGEHIACSKRSFLHTPNLELDNQVMSRFLDTLPAEKEALCRLCHLSWHKCTMLMNMCPGHLSQKPQVTRFAMSFHCPGRHREESFCQCYPIVSSFMLLRLCLELWFSFVPTSQT